MRKKGLFLFVLMIMGVISYFGGYYLYLSSNPKTEIADPVHFQRTGILAEDLQEGRQEYYLAKIDQESLVIYKMPEKIFYDSACCCGLLDRIGSICHEFRYVCLSGWKQGLCRMGKDR